MAKAKTFDLRKAEEHFKRVLMYVPGMLGNEAVNFFTNSFRQQGWLGNSFTPWRARKVSKWGMRDKRKGRAILIDSGRLRRSIRIVSNSRGIVRIGTDVPYAKAHNEGVRLGLIQNVKGHKRRLTKLGITKKKALKSRTRIEFGRVDSGFTVVKAHKRRIDQRIPQRQFMGSSPYLTARLKRILQAELMKGRR
jgi:phage gpG-like protein